MDKKTDDYTWFWVYVLLWFIIVLALVYPGV
jgi:hypothetical protein